MSDSEKTRRQRTDSDTSDLSTGASWTAAVLDLWMAWVVAGIAIVLTAYFYVNEDILATTAEKFYVIIFAGITVAAIVYGAYGVHDRTSPF